MDRKSEFIKDYKIKEIQEDIRLSKTSDNIYYNAVVTNNTSNTYIPVEYADNRNIPILNKPDDYYAAIIRFKAPLISIPIMFFKDNYYFVRLAFNGVNYEAAVQYIQVYMGQPQGTIFTLQQFLDYVNNTITTLYASIVAANPGNPAVPAGFAPRLIFNPVTQLFTLRCRDVFINTSPNANPPPSIDPPNPAVLNIYFSTTLLNLFLFEAHGNMVPVLPNTPSLIYVKDNGNNSITIGGNLYYDMTQEEQTTYLFNEFQNIIFISNTLGTKSESIPGLGNINIGQLTSGADNQISIIADFEPLQTTVIDRGYIQFFQTGPYKYIDFDTSQQLRNLKINAYWVDKDLQLHPVLLAPGQTFTMKILFKKKKVANAGK